MPKFGQKSSANISTCHRDLQTILRAAIKNCPVDFGVHEGKRTDKKQLEYFLSTPQRSRIDPRIPEQKAKGKPHNTIIRALAFKWIRIAYKCWKDKTPYDESTYLRALKERGSLLLKLAA